MKILIRLIGFISLTFLLSSCSYTPSLELFSSSVTITNDKNIVGAIGITEGEKKGQELLPTVLYYQFTLKNTGKKSIGGGGAKGLAVSIEPNPSLKSASEEIIGINVFNPDDYKNTGLGYGQSSSTLLKAGEEGYYTLIYDLGVSEESPNASLIVPSEEKLQKLKSKALEASLIVTCDGKEIARFDLNSN